MRAECLWNNLPEPPYRKKEINEAVSSGIGDRPDEQPWCYTIDLPQDTTAITIKVCGPGGFRWERAFDGPNEQRPELINRTVKANVPPYASFPDRE
jgi:hypothetical protein